MNHSFEEFEDPTPGVSVHTPEDDEATEKSEAAWARREAIEKSGPAIVNSAEVAASLTPQPPVSPDTEK